MEGWWGELAGAGKALDPSLLQLVGIDWLESGLEGPEIVTTFDQADHLARELDREGIDRLDLLYGSSFGGNVALCFASRYPARVGRLVIIGAAHRSHPMATALRSLQRRVVLLGTRDRAGSGCLGDRPRDRDDDVPHRRGVRPALRDHPRRNGCVPCRGIPRPPRHAIHNTQHTPTLPGIEPRPRPARGRSSVDHHPDAADRLRGGRHRPSLADDRSSGSASAVPPSSRCSPRSTDTMPF